MIVNNWDVIVVGAGAVGSAALRGRTELPIGFLSAARFVR